MIGSLRWCVLRSLGLLATATCLIGAYLLYGFSLVPPTRPFLPCQDNSFVANRHSAPPEEIWAPPAPLSNGVDKKDIAPQKKVIVWSAMRSGSSVFARSFMQRNDTVVFFEWLHDAYYYGPERRSRNYNDDRRYANVTYEDIFRRYSQSPPAGKTLTFVKDMATYIVPYGNTSFAWPEELDGFQHTFLVRSPRLQVHSLVKVMLHKQQEEDEDTGAPEGFDPAEIGVQQLHTLFHFVRNRTGTTPLLIDASDLFHDPATILSEYCKRIGVNFEDGMLHWKAGWREEFMTDTPDDLWVQDVLNSTGFYDGGSTERHKAQSSKIVKPRLPAIMEAGMEAAIKLYDELLSYKMSVPGQTMNTIETTSMAASTLSGFLPIKPEWVIPNCSKVNATWEPNRTSVMMNAYQKYSEGKGVMEANPRRVVFETPVLMQYADGMGRGLFTASPVARESIIFREIGAKTHADANLISLRQDDLPDFLKHLDDSLACDVALWAWADEESMMSGGAIRVVLSEVGLINHGANGNATVVCTCGDTDPVQPPRKGDRVSTFNCRVGTVCRAAKDLATGTQLLQDYCKDHPVDPSWFEMMKVHHFGIPVGGQGAAKLDPCL